jgi:hypothetical protein
MLSPVLSRLMIGKGETKITDRLKKLAGDLF